MLYSFSKHMLVNLFKHRRNITSLHDTYNAVCSPSKHFCKTVCTKNIAKDSSSIFLRLRRIKIFNSLAVNWKLICRVSGPRLSLGIYLNVLRPKKAASSLREKAEIFSNNKEACFLKQRGTLDFYPKIKDRNYFIYILWRIWDLFFTFLRFLRLGCTLLPILILYPISLINISLKNTWYSLLLCSLQWSGPIFIKLGQWASTRRDLFSEELCSHLEKLQRKNNPHSWYYTSKSFERVFGSNWRNILLLGNDGVPIGSGCCAQVYLAWVNFDFVMAAEDSSRSACSGVYNNNEVDYENSFAVEVLEMLGIGRLLSLFHGPTLVTEENKRMLVPVAVKVLHPRMSTHLRRDLCIMKVSANVLTWLFPGLKWISLPECVDDFTALMKAQADFCIEANNLETFSAYFADVDTVHFPRPIWSLTTPFCLVETYEEGQPMEYFIKNEKASETNCKLAKIGVNALLKMVFDDNFAHGDLHPGNVLVQERKCDLSECEWWRFGKKKKRGPQLRLVILDCGIVVSLDARGKRLLRQVFMAVANGDGERVAELFLDNSTHQCPNPDNFKQAMRNLVLTALGKSVSLSGFEVSSLIGQLFATMIQHKVKMDGCFSSVILAMMVVEGMGRSLDPTINMVETARPYLFRHIKD